MASHLHKWHRVDELKSQLCNLMMHFDTQVMHRNCALWQDIEIFTGTEIVSFVDFSHIRKGGRDSMDFINWHQKS